MRCIPHVQGTLGPLALLVTLLGCAEPPAYAPTLCARPRRPVAPESDLTLRLIPFESVPLAATLGLDGTHWRIGPANRWNHHQLVEPAQLLIRVEPISPTGGPAHHRLRVQLFPPLPRVLELPLLPVVPLSASMYRERLDLLTELVIPWAGRKIRRWAHRPIQLWLPPAGPRSSAHPDPRGACISAMQHWNDVAGEELIRATRDSARADVICTVHDEPRLAYTRALLRDPEGRPVRLRLHVSPRWNQGTEKYLRRVYLHELGHVLGFWGHSRELMHVMSGRALLGDAVHPHEQSALRLLWALPDGFDLSWVRRTGPPRVSRDDLPAPSAKLE